MSTAFAPRPATGGSRRAASANSGAGATAAGRIRPPSAATRATATKTTNTPPLPTAATASSTPLRAPPPAKQQPDLKSRASLLVLERWRRRSSTGAAAGAHNTLCRVARTVAHAKESEGTHRFLSYLFAAAAGDDEPLGPPKGEGGGSGENQHDGYGGADANEASLMSAPRSPYRSSPHCHHRAASVVSVAHTTVAVGGGSAVGEGDEGYFSNDSFMMHSFGGSDANGTANGGARRRSSAPAAHHNGLVLPRHRTGSGVGNATHLNASSEFRGRAPSSSSAAMSSSQNNIASNGPSGAAKGAANEEVSAPPPLVLDVPERLRPQDFVALHAVATTHPTLRAVLLRANPLDRLTAQALSRIISANTSITHIGWEGHCADGSGGRDRRGGGERSGILGGSSDEEGSYGFGSSSDESSSDDTTSSDDEGGAAKGLRSIGYVSAKAADARAQQTLQKVRRQMAYERRYPNGRDRAARLEAFKHSSGGGNGSGRGMGADSPCPASPTAGGLLLPSVSAASSASASPTKATAAASPASDAHRTAATSQHVVHDVESKEERRARARRAKALRALLERNRRLVADRRRREWVAREARLFEASVDALCGFVQRFVVAERSLRADLVAMESRQRDVVFRRVAAIKAEALRADRARRLLKGIADRLAWLAGREGSFRRLLVEEYTDDCAVLLRAMEASRRSAMAQTEAHSRVILRSIGNASWAAAVRAERGRREAQRIGKLELEAAEEASRHEAWSAFALSLRSLKHSEQSEGRAVQSANAAKAERERREAAALRRQEELAKEREAREARAAAQRREAAEGAARREIDKMHLAEAQRRERHTAACLDFFAAMADLRGFEEALLSPAMAEHRTRDDAVQYLQLLSATSLAALRGGASACAGEGGVHPLSPLPLDRAVSGTDNGVLLDSQSAFAGGQSLSSPPSASIAAPLTHSMSIAPETPASPELLLGGTLSALPQHLRWAQLFAECAAKARLPPVRPRAPACAAWQPLVATEHFAESALETLLATKLL